MLRQLMNWLGDSPKGRKLGRVIVGITIGTKLFELVDVHSETSYRTGELEETVLDLRCRFDAAMLRAAFAERLARRALEAQELDLDNEWRAFLVESGEVAPDVVAEQVFVPGESVVNRHAALPNLADLGVEAAEESEPFPKEAA